MIISNSKKFIYIHIPKCGGTSISSTFERYLGPQDVSLNKSPHTGWKPMLDVYRKRWGLHKHSKAAELAAAMGEDCIAEYEIFTFIRNPFARAYSSYTFTLKADSQYRPASPRYAEVNKMTLEEFLSSRHMNDPNLLAVRPQSEWIRRSPPNIRMFRLEDIDTVLPDLVRKYFGEDVGITVPRANASTNALDAWKAMSEEAETLIRGLYADDFKILGYSDRIAR